MSTLAFHFGLPETKATRFCFMFIASPSQCPFGLLVQEQNQCWQASVPREACPSPGLGVSLHRWMEGVGNTDTASWDPYNQPPSNHLLVPQTQVASFDPKVQEFPEFKNQLAASFEIFWASRI